MLTSLNFLTPGQLWPPPTEAERLERYAQNRLLFEGKHELVYKDWIRLLREDQQAILEIVLNWYKRLTLLFADLLLGEQPRITAGDKDSQEQQTVERIIDDNDATAPRGGADGQPHGNRHFRWHAMTVCSHQVSSLRHGSSRRRQYLKRFRPR